MTESRAGWQEFYKREFSPGVSKPRGALSVGAAKLPLIVVTEMTLEVQTTVRGSAYIRESARRGDSPPQKSQDVRPARRGREARRDGDIQRPRESLRTTGNRRAPA